MLRKLTPIESEVVCNDGRILMRRVTPYRAEDHRIGGVVITFIDITQRKRAEQAVVEAKELAEKIIDTVPEPMLVLDAEFFVERANGAFFSAFETDRDATLGHSLFEVGGGAWDGPELRARLSDILPQQTRFSRFEVSQTFEHIGRRTILVTAQQINDLPLILLVLDDITERKKFEEALRGSEQRLRRVVQTEAVGVMFYDGDGRVVDANDKFLDTVGATRADVEAGAVSWQKLTPPEYVQNTEEQLRRLAADGRLGPYEKQFLRRDGMRVWAMIAGASLGDGNWVEFSIDIESRKRAEQALLESDRRKDEFLATLAHELRNPLAPLTTAVQVLRHSTEGTAETREHIYAMMERQLGHLARLVDDLLDVARVSRGFIELRTEPIEVATVLRTALETVSPRMDAADRQLSVVFPKESLVVKGDSVRLAQVVVNLLNNATSYTSKNGHIWLSARREGRHAVLSVLDDGVGMAPDALSKVFEIFVQVDRSRAGGLGIGLTLARSLVQLHGGTIEARSAGLGKGSEFIVRLPLYDGPSQRAPDESECGRHGSAGRARTRRRRQSRRG